MRIVQISDTHLYADASQTLLKLNTRQSLEAVVQSLQADVRQPDAIILTGDLSQDNSERAYKSIVSMFASFACPIYTLPGNHDDPALLESIFQQAPFKRDKIILQENWRLILLNSHYPHHVAGLLSHTELSRLAHYLEQDSTKDTLIFLHHPPVPVGAAWLDQSRLINAEALFECVDKYATVRGIICGHVHQVFEGYHKHIALLSSPSTCIQFLPLSHKFALDTLAPGYRWIELQQDGNFKTGVERVKNFENTADFMAEGY